jgi:hypothetical protein
VTPNPDLPPVLDPAHASTPYASDVEERLPPLLDKLKAYNDGVKRGRSELSTIARPLVDALRYIEDASINPTIPPAMRKLIRSTLEAYEANARALQKRP